MRLHVVVSTLLLALGSSVVAAPIQLRPGTPPDDAVWRAILDGGRSGPADIFEIRQRLESLGGELETHIVDNRGFNNPEAGSFSFFESYSGPMPGGTVQRGELLLGFFTERHGDTLAVQHSPDAGLMVELIAWDYAKKMFGFWELIGKNGASQWHYRGDSSDVLADIERIDVGDTKPRFGARLRCSGCHSWGGPILKELEPPHNDWWSAAHRLNLGTIRLESGADRRNPRHEAHRLFAAGMDAWNLGRLVKVGTARMIALRAQRGWDGQSVRQRVRSLFSTVEMNLASDREPFDGRNEGDVEIPAAFFVDARLSGPAEPIRVAVPLYREALARIGSTFAPDEVPGLVETRHAHLVPVRSFVDDTIVGQLMTDGLLDAEIVADVLAVDPTTPVYSRARSSLIRHVPEEAGDTARFTAALAQALRAAPAEPAARELLANLTDPARTAGAHRARATAYLATCRAASGSLEAVVDWLRIASQRRAEVAQAESSQNPRGTILEPGFRVIFPRDSLRSVPGRLTLDPATARVREAAAARLRPDR